MSNLAASDRSRTFRRLRAALEARSIVERHKKRGRDLRVQSPPLFFVGLVQAGGFVVLKKRINGERFLFGLDAVV